LARAEAVEQALAAPARLDARKLRGDFPIFEQRFHGKPLAYLDYRSVNQQPPLAKPPPVDEPAPSGEPLQLDRLRRRDRLGGVLHEYELAA
jgi:hypothetical protein